MNAYRGGSTMFQAAAALLLTSAAAAWADPSEHTTEQPPLYRRSCCSLRAASAICRSSMAAAASGSEPVKTSETLHQVQLCALYLSQVIVIDVAVPHIHACGAAGEVRRCKGEEVVRTAGLQAAV